MSNTLRLLSKLFDSADDFMEAKKAGVNSSTFYTADEQAVWGLVDAYFQKHANVPPIEDAVKLIPAFTPVDPGQFGMSELIERVNKERMEIAIRSTMTEVEGLLSQDKYREAISLMHHGAAAASKGYGLSQDESISAYGNTIWNVYRHIKENKGVLRGVPWPWDPLNEETGGLLKGTYNVIYGRPKSTKTFRLLEIAIAAQRASKRVLIVSCEMLDEVMFQRLGAVACELDYGKVRKGLLNEAEEAILEAYASNCENVPPSQEIVLTHLSDRSDGKTASSLRSKIEEHEPDILLVDSIYKMTDEQTGKRDASPQTIRNISYDIQQIAQATRLPTVVTTQVNRKGERARLGTTADAAFSDAFSMDCDIMLRLANDKRIERTVFLITAARECDIDGFTTGNKCCCGLGPIQLPGGGGPDWSLPAHYLEDSGDSSDKPRFTE